MFEKLGIQTVSRHLLALLRLSVQDEILIRGITSRFSVTPAVIVDMDCFKTSSCRDMMVLLLGRLYMVVFLSSSLFSSCSCTVLKQQLHFFVTVVHVLLEVRMF